MQWDREGWGVKEIKIKGKKMQEKALAVALTGVQDCVNQLVLKGSDGDAGERDVDQLELAGKVLPLRVVLFWLGSDTWWCEELWLQVFVCGKVSTFSSKDH